MVGRRYASYGGRFEEAIVKQMIRNDGGDCNSVRIHTLPKHGYTPDIEAESSVVAANLKHGLSDATWIFEHWV